MALLRFLAFVGDQRAIVPVVVYKVSGDAVGNMLAAAPNGWVVEHVDDRPVDVGHHDPRAAAPNTARTEELPGMCMTQQETGAVMDLVFVADRTPHHHDDRPEQLLRETPVLRSSSAANVTRRVERRNENPWVVQDSLPVDGVQQGGSVRSGANATQPALSRPA